MRSSVFKCGAVFPISYDAVWNHRTTLVSTPEIPYGIRFFLEEIHQWSLDNVTPYVARFSLLKCSSFWKLSLGFRGFDSRAPGLNGGLGWGSFKCPVSTLVNKTKVCVHTLRTSTPRRRSSQFHARSRAPFPANTLNTHSHIICDGLIFGYEPIQWENQFPCTVSTHVRRIYINDSIQYKDGAT